MREPSLIIITGLPRSGTSFLHRALAHPLFRKSLGWNMYALPPERDHQAAGTFEPQQFYHVRHDPTATAQVLREWVQGRRMEHPEKVLLIKENPLLFSIPVELASESVRYVLSTRPLDPWLVAAHKHGPSIEVATRADRRSMFVQRWPLNWDFPKELDARLRICHRIYQLSIEAAADAIGDACHVFTYESEESVPHQLADLFRFFGVPNGDELAVRITRDCWHRQEWKVPAV